MDAREHAFDLADDKIPSRTSNNAEESLSVRSESRSGSKAVQLALFSLLALPQALHAQNVPTDGPPDGKQALANGEFAKAKIIYREYLRTHPTSVPGELGLADAELGLHEYQAAELQYRAVTAAQPELWIAHKNLVIIEAALGRWDEFDRERSLLRGARERGAIGISKHESDVIDTFDVRGQHWIVREYDEPSGRSLTRYNFELFSPNGKAQEYISLESEQASKNALAPQDTRIGSNPDAPAIHDFALNFYTSKGHGTIAHYPKGEPTYERVRTTVIAWLRRAK
jgi:hypothetical protein